ncbi:MAG: AI-2E family transporter [Candidatus Cloacimonetes bacterium]|nr:AI-2E family transporter [Candidatus Cloacimonadota bacterium]
MKESNGTETNLRWIKVSVSIIALAIIITVLKELKSIFIPLTIAILLAFAFAPLLRFFRRKRATASVGIGITVIIVFFTFTLGGILVYTGLASFASQADKYERQLGATINELSDKFEMPISSVKTYLKNNVNWMDVFNKVPITRFISGTMGTFLNFLFKLLLTIVLMVFFMAGRERLGVRLVKVMTKEETVHSKNIFKNVEEQLISYLFGKSLISLGTALSGMFYLAILRIDFVIMSGLLLFILNFIPNFGSIIASAFPIIICFLQYGFGWQLFAVAGSMIFIQILWGTIIEPRYFGKTMNLSPVVILSALIFWAYIWGVVGMFLAVPLISSISIIIREFPSMRFITALLSDD